MKKSPLFFLLLFSCAFAWMIAASAQSNYEPYTFTTFAGNSGYGTADGTGTAARFWYPSGVTVDSAGNVYVADFENCTIRKIAPAGVVSTFCGFPRSFGSADGAGPYARFSLPADVAIDGSGNLYVADSGNDTIRKITANGVATTLAGLPGSSGSTDGIGSMARFNNPQGVAVDGAGNVYVADTYNHTIRKITADGVVSTLAGLAGHNGAIDGAGSAALFNRPWDVATDNAGNIFVADSYSHRIRKVTPAGVVTTFAGSSESGNSDGVGTAARFWNPQGVAVDGTGNVYVADTANQTIRKITPDATVTTLAGLAYNYGSADGIGSAARFTSPRGVVTDNNGNVYVGDTQNHTIRKITSAAAVTTFAGLAGGAGTADGVGTAARFYYPIGVAVDNKRNVYVADSHESKLRKITPAGAVSTLVGNVAQFSNPYSVAADNAGNVLVGTAGGIRKVGPCGVISTFAGGEGIFAAGLAIDDAGNVYITSNQTIRKITPAGTVSTLAGLAGSSGSADGTGSAARFNGPSGVALDTMGNIYVADSRNHTIRKITPTGTVSTLVGLGGNRGSVDGIGSEARFSDPRAVTIDAGNIIYVADSGNNIIRKVTPTGVVTTLAGVTSVVGSSEDGTGSAARFYGPWGIAVDSIGNLYVTEYFNQTVRVGRIPSPRAKLSNLTASVAPLSPPFSPATISYIISVPNSVTSTNVTPTRASADATITVNGSPATSGVPFGPIALDAGANIITVVVTAAGDTKPYTVQINRAPLVSNLNDDGAGSLRQALCEANSGDTIVFDLGSQAKTPAVPVIITLTSGELVLDKSISISGPGADLLTIKRDPSAASFRIFNVHRDHTVTIEGLTISGGQAPGPGVDLDGGGIYNDRSMLTINRCAITGNTAWSGAGVFNSSTLNVQNSTISGNHAIYNGGGVYSGKDYANTDLTVNNSTFNRNTAGLSGAAICNSTYLYGNGTAMLKLANSTLSGNSSPNGVLGNISGVVTISNTLLNIGTGGASLVNVNNGTIISAGYNLSSDNGGGFLTATGDQINTDPMLGPLQDNGGPTLTHAPLVNSPAVDKGKRDTIVELATDFDQRGSVRPIDDPAVANATGGDASDIGAVELGVGVHPIAATSLKVHGDAGSFPINLPLTGTPGIECRSGGPNGDYQLIVTFSQPITFSTAAVTSGTGHVSGASVTRDSYSRRLRNSDGNSETQVTINLTGVANAQVITVGLFDVTDGTHNGDVGIRMAVLVGDTTANGTVNVTDISQTKSQSGHAVTADNFRADVTANGVITATDVSLVKSKSGTALP